MNEQLTDEEVRRLRAEQDEEERLARTKLDAEKAIEHRIDTEPPNGEAWARQFGYERDRVSELVRRQEEVRTKFATEQAETLKKLDADKAAQQREALRLAQQKRDMQISQDAEMRRLSKQFAHERDLIVVADRFRDQPQVEDNRWWFQDGRDAVDTDVRQALANRGMSEAQIDGWIREQQEFSRYIEDTRQRQADADAHQEWATRDSEWRQMDDRHAQEMVDLMHRHRDELDSYVQQANETADDKGQVRDREMREKLERDYESMVSRHESEFMELEHDQLQEREGVGYEYRDLDNTRAYTDARDDEVERQAFDTARGDQAQNLSEQEKDDLAMMRDYADQNKDADAGEDQGQRQEDEAEKRKREADEAAAQAHLAQGRSM